jgi:hypothetical protein
MAVLTRRRDHDRRDECWLIYFGDVHEQEVADAVETPRNCGAILLSVTLSLPSLEGGQVWDEEAFASAAWARPLGARSIPLATSEPGRAGGQSSHRRYGTAGPDGGQFHAPTPGRFVHARLASERSRSLQAHFVQMHQSDDEQSLPDYLGIRPSHLRQTS